MKIKIKKGLDLKIYGAATDSSIHQAETDRIAIDPDDFTGLKPKLDVKEGDSVAIGSPLMHDKYCPEVKIVSPIAGRVKSIVRGERRKILRVEVESCDVAADAVRYEIPSGFTAENAVRLLAESGLLAEMSQRPYAIVPETAKTPRDIFVTAIDSAPLAAAYETYMPKDLTVYEAAVKLLSAVTSGKVYISHREGSFFGNIKGAESVTVTGPHPSGNAGVQAANIAPVNKGETIWTLGIDTLYRIGVLVTTGRRDCTTVVAVTGPEVEKPSLVKTVFGAPVATVIKGLVKKSDHHIRIISGNVFTGVAEKEDGYMHFPYRQITVIAEGDDVDEFMGWASLKPSKASVSPTFPGHFLSRLFAPDARLNGGRRAMIMSGEYDRVVPLDIMSEYLIKAIISHDIDAMEKLGIYEVAPEDFAAAEYVDTSKLPLQQIVREGLDYMRRSVE